MAGLADAETYRPAAARITRLLRMTQRPKACVDLIMHTYINLLLAAAGLIGCLLSVPRTLFSRPHWQAKYFEAGSDLPYRIEVFLLEPN